MTEFKQGDRVFDIQFGWGEVIAIRDLSEYTIEVVFEKVNEWYTSDGRPGAHHNPTLSHTEYSMNSTSEFPKVMEVSRYGEEWFKRVVIAKNKFLRSVG